MLPNLSNELVIKNPRKLLVSAALIIIVFNILDLWTTYHVLGNGGQEANPLTKLLIDHNLIIPLKVILPIFILLDTAFVKKSRTILNILSIWFTVGVYFCVVLANGLTWWTRY